MATPPQALGSTVPTYDKMMLPLLLFAADGKEHRVNESVVPVASHFSLDQKAREETLPDGRNRLLHRIEWARTYLKKAGLLEYPRRGALKITQRGLEVLSKKPAVIDIKLLEQFPEFREFKNPSSDDSEDNVIEENLHKIDPEESLENGYQAIRRTLEDEILAKIKTNTPEFFEQLVIDLLLKMGYGGSKKEAGKAIGKTGDGGIDGIINEDALGLDVIYIQAKCWEYTVGRPEIQKFVGALQGHRARKGVFITTSNFSKDAREYTSVIDCKVILVDGLQLASLMFQHDIGVSEVKTYRIKRIDSDYFEEE